VDAGGEPLDTIRVGTEVSFGRDRLSVSSPWGLRRGSPRGPHGNNHYYTFPQGHFRASLNGRFSTASLSFKASDIGSSRLQWCKNLTHQATADCVRPASEGSSPNF